MDATRDLIKEIVVLVNTNLVFSDLMIEEDEPVMANTPYGWAVVDSLMPVSREDLTPLMLSIDEDWEDKLAKGALNRPIDLTNWRLRINAYLAFGGKKIMLSVRKIPANPIALKDTGLPQSVRLMLDNSKGLILVNGCTGSGKSTSLAAMIDVINESRKSHVITIEDPIEFKFRRKKSIFSQREIGVDVGSFYEGVRDALRQKPDVLVIGEIRDKDTAETALLASESGVLVIGTLHANSAPAAVQKLLSYFPSSEREVKLQSLKSSLVGVISQLLLPKIGGQGWALAAEMMFNHKQQCSGALGNLDQLEQWLERADDKISCTMATALLTLVKSGQVEKTDAIKAMSGIGQSAFIDRLRQ